MTYRGLAPTYEPPPKRDKNKPTPLAPRKRKAPPRPPNPVTKSAKGLADKTTLEEANRGWSARFRAKGRDARDVLKDWREGRISDEEVAIRGVVPVKYKPGRYAAEDEPGYVLFRYPLGLMRRLWESRGRMTRELEKMAADTLIGYWEMNQDQVVACYRDGCDCLVLYQQKYPREQVFCSTRCASAARRFDTKLRDAAVTASARAMEQELLTKGEEYDVNADVLTEEDFE